MTAGRPPLSGIKVLEVANFIAGPYCGMQLADLGADVVKVENPVGGDMVRQTAPFIEGISSNFIRLNRNKRSLALDLKAPEGKAIFRQLATRADIIVENLRPGTMAELGLDYARLRPLNRGLIYVAASGWGQDGPYAQLAGLDIIAQGMSGLMSITGIEGGEPVKVGVPITDLVCALYGALGAVAALNARHADGEGQLIDVSLFESGVSLAMWEAGKYFATGEVAKRQGSAHQVSAPYQAIRSSDGYFTAGATTPKNWNLFCSVLGLEAIRDEPRYAENYLRRQHKEELMPVIEAVTTTKPAAYWVERLQEVGVPCGLLQDYGQVFTDPHLKARNMFVDAPHAKLGPVKQIASAMRFSRTPTRMTAAGPLLGEHSREVLGELGLSDDETQRLLTAGIAAVAP
ncbi:MAG: CoA transferase [Candidatus Eremiobacteraeota bacterium]|nr:CoA transferase [Candidatus Eremiobacteraeota bacterium]